MLDSPQTEEMRRPRSPDFAFDSDNREYVIRKPDTPLPWINFLGSRAFYSIVSNTGGGYSFYRDAKLRRLTRYRYDSVPMDGDGKYLYITDGTSTWNPGWRPTRTPLDDYECRHGLGYSRFRSSKDSLLAQLDVFVVDELDAEIQALTLTNNSSEKKSVRVVSYVEWCQWNAEDDASNLQRNLSIGEVQVADGILCHTTGYRERRDHFAYHTSSREPQGFDTDRDSFLGPYGDTNAPAAVIGQRSSDSLAAGWWPIASLAHSIELNPGESASITYATGYAENSSDKKWDEDGRPNTEIARSVRQRIAADGFAESELSRLKARWRGILSCLHVETPEAQFNDLLNTWNAYQCMVTFELARSASSFETGNSRGIGFRDSNQDCLGVVHLIPERVGERLKDLAATQQSDGSAYHQYQPLTKSGNAGIGSGFNDDPLWLVLSVAAYVRESGDLEFLETPVEFEDTTATGAKIIDHLRASLAFTQNNLGPHGLPLIGRADWNDCLNLNAHSDNPDESFQCGPLRSSGKAESTVIAALYVLAAREFAGLCSATGNAEEAQSILRSAETMAETVASHGWDGEWFLRAYDHNGGVIGSSTCEEGQIYIEPQGLCAMASIGLEGGLVESSLDSVAERLTTSFGICLLDPPYRAYDKSLGEIATYIPGLKENGSVFCHNNPWVIIGETVLGNGDRAMEYLRSIAPTYQTDPSIRRIEPYVYAQTIAGKAAPVPGEGKNSWLTGTASWSYVAASQYILGIRAEIDGLRVNPCIPKQWKSFKATRLFRGATYRIEVANPRGTGSGVAQISVDGQVIEGDVIPVAAAGSKTRVVVELK